MSSRGQWDRSATAESRAGAHRQAILEAAARAAFELGRAVTVSDVVERAGVGRNTFYVNFADLEAAFRAAEESAIATVSRAFAPSRDARTPIERLRTTASEWIRLAMLEPRLVMLVLRGDGRPTGAHSTVREIMVRSFESVAAAARSAGLVGRPVDSQRLRATAAAFVATAESLIESPPRGSAQPFADELVELSLRIFR